MAVVIGPIQRHRTAQGFGQAAHLQIRHLPHHARLRAKLLILVLEQRSGAPVLGLQGTHHTNQIIVPDAFKFADRMHARLCI